MATATQRSFCSTAWEALVSSCGADCCFVKTIESVIKAVKGFFGFYVELSPDQVRTLEAKRVQRYKVEEGDPSKRRLEEALTSYLSGLVVAKLDVEDSALKRVEDELMALAKSSSDRSVIFISQALADYWARRLVGSEYALLDDLMAKLFQHLVGDPPKGSPPALHNLWSPATLVQDAVLRQIELTVSKDKQEGVKRAFVPVLNKDGLIAALGDANSAVTLLSSIMKQEIESSLGSRQGVEAFFQEALNRKSSEKGPSREMKQLIALATPFVVQRLLSLVDKLDWSALFHTLVERTGEHVGRVETAVGWHRRLEALKELAEKIQEDAAETVLQRATPEGFEALFLGAFRFLPRDGQARFMVESLMPIAEKLFDGQCIRDLLVIVGQDPLLKDQPLLRHFGELSAEMQAEIVNLLSKVLLLTIENQLAIHLHPDKVESIVAPKEISSLLNHTLLPIAILSCKASLFRQELYFDQDGLVRAVKGDDASHLQGVIGRTDHMLRDPHSRERYHSWYQEEIDTLRQAVWATGNSLEDSSPELIKEVIRLQRLSLPQAHLNKPYNRLIDKALVTIGRILPGFSLFNAVGGGILSSSLYPFRISHVEVFNIAAGALTDSGGPQETKTVEELAKVIYLMLMRQQQQGRLGPIREALLQAFIGNDSKHLEKGIQEMIDNLLLKSAKVNRSLVNSLFEELVRGISS